MKLSLFCGLVVLTDLDVAAPKIVGLAATGPAMNVEVTELDAGQSNENSLDFRFAGGFWVYNLSTAGLAPNKIYVLTIEMPDGRLFRAVFDLR